jgi:hypothetical protein
MSLWGGAYLNRGRRFSLIGSQPTVPPRSEHAPRLAKMRIGNLGMVKEAANNGNLRCQLAG